MNFCDNGIIINIKNYSERDAIVKVFSQNHGIYRGFVKKIDTRQNRTIFQIGNKISFEWKSRVEEALGAFYYYDLNKSYLAKILFERIKLTCFSSIISIIDSCFLEREFQNEFYLEFCNFLEFLACEESSKNEILKKYIILELKILEIMGYGVDLSCCAATGESENLIYVSPKSGRAVSKNAGIIYHDKLLKLPQFLLDNFSFDNKFDKNFDNEIFDGFKLSGYFLEKFVFSQNKSEFLARKSVEKEILSC